MPALLLVGAITVLDALLSTHAVLIELLAAGPLVAAARSTPRQTAIVGAVALAASVAARTGERHVHQPRATWWACSRWPWHPRSR